MKFRNILSIFLSIVLFLLIGESVGNMIHFSSMMPQFVRRFAPENAVIFSLFSPELLFNLAKVLLAYGIVLAIWFAMTALLPLMIVYFLVRHLKGAPTAKKLFLKISRYLSLIFVIVWLVFSIIASTTDEQFSLLQAFLEFLFMFSVFFKFHDRNLPHRI
ncbi:MAG: hypothetical protein FWF59_07350 [Turicibacter sp.]|nr:hypothetical protein [Turicibacter sp.]